MNFVNWMLFAKIFPTKIDVLWVWSIGFQPIQFVNFFPRNLNFKQFAKIFSHENFPLYGNKVM